MILCLKQSCVCDVTGAEEDARGHPVHREGLYDVHGERDA